MSLKFSGFLFVLCIFLEAISGLAANTTSAAKKPTQDVPVVPASTTAKLQNSSKENDGPVVVPDSAVTIIVPSSADILPKSTIMPPASSNTTPAPPLAPELGKWTIKKDGRTCIIAQMMMQLNVTYPATDKKIRNTLLNVPGKNSTATGNCKGTPQSMNITWGPGHSLQINFGMNDTVHEFFISGLSLNVNASVFKDVAENTSIINYQNTGSEFATPLDMSYKCNKAQNLSLESDHMDLKAVVSLSDTQFEAYMNKTKEEFGEVQDCDAFDTPDIVPIVVACALGTLVLVILAAYLIGRKRSQNRGYLSM